MPPETDASRKLSLETNTLIWYDSLLAQARGQGGTVTISIPSLNIEMNLTENDILTAIEKIQNPKPKISGIIIEGQYSEVID